MRQAQEKWAIGGLMPACLTRRGGKEEKGRTEKRKPVMLLLFLEFLTVQSIRTLTFYVHIEY